MCSVPNFCLFSQQESRGCSQSSVDLATIPIIQGTFETVILSPFRLSIELSTSPRIQFRSIHSVTCFPIAYVWVTLIYERKFVCISSPVDTAFVTSFHCSCRKVGIYCFIIPQFRCLCCRLSSTNMFVPAHMFICLVIPSPPPMPYTPINSLCIRRSL